MSIYGKLELVDKGKVLYTVEDFTDLKEFQVDTMYKTLTRNLRKENEKNKCKDCTFSYDSVLVASPEEYVLKVARFVKDNILECKDLSLMDCFNDFITFYYLLSEFRHETKKKS